MARYQAESYADSAALFAEQGDSRSLYNLGNAMAMQGNFDSAIDAYEQVLEIDPTNEDARYNLEIVEQAKEQQEAEEQGQGDDQQSTQESWRRGRAI